MIIVELTCTEQEVEDDWHSRLQSESSVGPVHPIHGLVDASFDHNSSGLVGDQNVEHPAAAGSRVEHSNKDSGHIEVHDWTEDGGAAWQSA